ncbi:hypothetical protein [Streptomyces oceani]|nr:hypothetical protein [Streptomyces oceani]
MAQKLATGVLYLCTIGVAFLVKRGVMRHCPQCHHLLSKHARRSDGSFRD